MSAEQPAPTAEGLEKSAPLGGRVARAVMWGGFTTIATRIVHVVMTAVVVRIVSPAEFGTYAVALTVFTVISGFSELGLSACLARRDWDPDEIGPTVTALSIIAGCAIAGAMAAAAGPLASALGAPEADQPLRVLSLCVVMVGLFAAPSGLATREFRQDVLFKATVWSFLPANLLLVVLAVNGDGAMAFAWSRVVGQLILGGVVARYMTFYRPRIERAQLRRVVGFGVPFAGSNFVRFVLLNADYLFIGRLLGPTAVGVYTLAFNVGSWASSVLTGVINSVAMPAFSQANLEPGRLRQALRDSTELVALIAFPIAGFSVALAEPVVRVLYGDTWLAAIPILRILGVYGALFVITQLLGNVIVAVGMSGRALFLQVSWLVGLVPAMALGVTLGKLPGAALAHVVVIVLIVIPLHLYLINRRVPGTPRVLLSATGRPLVLTVVTSLLAFWLSTLVQDPFASLMVGGWPAGLLYLALSVPSMVALVPEQTLRRVSRPLAVYEAFVGRWVRHLPGTTPPPARTTERG